LHATPAPGVLPFDRAIGAGDHAGPALETTGKFDGHLSLFRQPIEACGACINTKSFFTGMTDLLIEKDMGLLVVFESIKGQFLRNLHFPNLS
jgi:hypothetical protein